MQTNQNLTADRLQDYLAGRLSDADHRCVERAIARDPGALRRFGLLRDAAALLRQGIPGPAPIPADWLEILDHRSPKH